MSRGTVPLVSASVNNRSLATARLSLARPVRTVLIRIFLTSLEVHQAFRPRHGLSWCIAMPLCDEVPHEGFVAGFVDYVVCVCVNSALVPLCVFPDV